MDREQLLKQEIEKLIAHAREKGTIPEEEVMTRLEHLGATAEDLEGVFKALSDENITVVSSTKDDEDID